MTFGHVCLDVEGLPVDMEYR